METDECLLDREIREGGRERDRERRRRWKRGREQIKISEAIIVKMKIT